MAEASLFELPPTASRPLGSCTTGSLTLDNACHETVSVGQQHSPLLRTSQAGLEHIAAVVGQCSMLRSGVCDAG